MNSVLNPFAVLFCAAPALAPHFASAQTTLVNASDTWRYHKGTNAPQAGWKTIPDASLNVEWAGGPGGFGYGDGDDATTLSDMLNRYTTVYNGEHAFMQKDRGMGILQNNTILRLTPNPLSNNTDADGDEAPGIILFGEPWRGFPYGDGAIFEGNIASDLQVADPWPVLVLAQAANPNFFFLRDHNCVQGFDQPGMGNINTDPLFVGTTGLTAANIRQMLALQPGSPCIGTGPNGLDMGAIVPSGASLSGVPVGATTNQVRRSKSRARESGLTSGGSTAAPGVQRSPSCRSRCGAGCLSPPAYSRTPLPFCSPA